jgi:hypothetical protein
MFYLGPGPLEEDLVDYGQPPGYMLRMRAELRAYLNQLNRVHPPPGDARFDLLWEESDFGFDGARQDCRYGEVVAVFDTERMAEVEWAVNAEQCPCLRWDERAIEELSEAGFPPCKSELRASGKRSPD